MADCYEWIFIEMWWWQIYCYESALINFTLNNSLLCYLYSTLIFTIDTFLRITHFMLLFITLMHHRLHIKYFIFSLLYIFSFTYVYFDGLLYFVLNTWKSISLDKNPTSGNIQHIMHVVHTLVNRENIKAFFLLCNWTQTTQYCNYMLM